jgi:DeoR/GlpR family transcriptional regulator of sugar metabolism
MFVINERQSKILDLLKKHRHLKTSEIAEKVNVSQRTLQHDLLFLRKEFYNIEIKKGKYHGGVYWHADK